MVGAGGGQGNGEKVEKGEEKRTFKKEKTKHTSQRGILDRSSRNTSVHTP
jgi:hypothetical protein